MSRNSLPPIIEQNIIDLEDPRVPSHVKFNIASNLDNVIKYSQIAVKKYRSSGK